MKVVFGIAVFAAPASAGPCAPAAILSGERDAIATVGDELHRLGVATEVVEGCTAVRADVKRDDKGISIAIGREGRVVGDPAVAAAWIDSWVRDDLAGYEETVAATPVPARVVAEAPPPVEPPSRVSLRAGYVHGWAGGGWDGFEAGGCVHLGFACVGAKAGALFQSQVQSRQTLADRSDLVAMATASKAFAVGQVQLVPELGVGFGRLRTGRVDGCRVPQGPGCDPNNPMGQGCTPKPTDCVDDGHSYYVGDGYQAVTYAPRASAMLRVAVPIAHDIYFDGTAGVVLAPGAHREVFQAHPTMAPPTTQDQLILPGESLASFQLGVGLRIGAP